MLDLILTASLNTSITQPQILAQARAAVTYLPVTVQRSTSNVNCLLYTAKNITGRKISNLRVTKRDNRGKTYSTSLSPSSLEPRKTASFTICDNSFVNVGGNQ